MALASNDAVVSDITSSNPRIAPLGQSELAVLGINIVMDANDGTHNKTLQSFVVQLRSDDAAGVGEAALSNIETARFYSDSGLSGTGGQFDSQDALVDAVSRASATDADGDGDTINTTLIAQVNDTAAELYVPTDPGIAADTTSFCVDDAANGLLFALGDVVEVQIDAVLSYRTIVAIDVNGINECDDDDSSTLIEFELDTAVVGLDTADATDTIDDLATYPAGVTALNFTGEAAVTAEDFVKVGAGLTAEIVTIEADLGIASNSWTIDGIPGGGLTGTVFAHANLEAVVEVANQVANILDSGGEGFSDFAAAGLHAGYEMGIAWGDTTIGADGGLGYTPPSTDTGTDAGNDMFITFLTAGGVANQTFIAAIWSDVSTRLQLNDSVADTRNMAVNSNTTNNETKTITFGSDGVAPTIQHVWTYDNDGDGNVDRVRVHFSEAMASIGANLLTNNFKSAIGGNENNIESTPASVDEIDLTAGGAWQTTTVLNDTFQMDFGGDTQSANCAAEVATTYCNATASTGDSWTVVYDSDATGEADDDVVADDFTDATGQLLADQSVTTTDMARPGILAASQVRDNDGDSQVDQLRVALSETMAGTSTSSGLALRNITSVPSVLYTLGAVSGFATSVGVVADGNGNAATANTSDTVLVAVTESGGVDVANNYTLDYTAASTLSDPGANEARSITGMALGTGSAPFVLLAYFLDLDNVAAGVAALAGDDDADGQIDALFVQFNQNVDIQENALGDLADLEMALSGGYTFQANTLALDEDNDNILVFPIGQSGATDTDRILDWTYTDDGAADNTALCSVGTGHVGNTCTGGAGAGVNDVLLGGVLSGTVTEQNLAGPRLQTATLYETTANDIWGTGETMSLVFSENLDASTIRTSWSLDSLLLGPSDFAWAGIAANEMPDSGTISVSGSVVTFTATASANATMTAADSIVPQTNEIFDSVGNAAPNNVADSSAFILNNGLNDQIAVVLLTVTPVAAPAVLRVMTNDENGNGILDSFLVELAGLVSPTSIALADWSAAKGSDFNANTLGLPVGFPACAGAIGDNRACSTTNVSPDLTLTDVATLNGSNDSRVIVRYTEAGEDTGARPQLKYVQGSFADLAGNKIASFNNAAGDNARFDVLIGDVATEFASLDRVAPMLMLKHLKDRDVDGKYDQAVLVFSETMLNGAGLVANGVLASNGIAVAGKTIAANGATINNTDYQHITFAVNSNVYRVDVNEGAAVDTVLPGVSYVGSGLHRDAGGNTLATFAAGGETGTVNPPTTPPSTVSDGDLFQGTGPEVWIAKVSGSQMFRRHVLFSNFDTFYPHLAPFWSNVEMVSDATVATYSMSAWVRVAGTAPVYEINDDNTKHWITCADDSVAGQDCANEWTSSGRNAAGIYDVNSAEFNSYTTGPTVIMPDVMN